MSLYDLLSAISLVDNGKPTIPTPEEMEAVQKKIKSLNLPGIVT